jgi:hypothetical protein
MGNPNNSTRLQRQNSLPSRLEQRYSRLRIRLRMKTNPYVGSFRHSPPTSFRSMEASTDYRPNLFLPSSTPLRNSPYIGWFRHAPPINIDLHKADQRELIDKYHQLVTLLGRLPDADVKRTRLEFTEIIDGRLRGGTKDTLANLSDASRFAHSVHKLLEESCNESSSSTVKVLAKLGSWFLFPLAYDAASCGYRDCEYDIMGSAFCPDDERKEEDDSSEDSVSEFEDESCDSSEDEDSVALSDINGPQTKPSSLSVPLDISVSEIAEAYYAHQVMDQSEYSSAEGHRLDYVITQMDIARMARNASRHLDVDSILNLPTVTYKSPNRVVQHCGSPSSAYTNEAFSFILVEQPKKTEEGADSTLPNHDDVCVICLEHYKEGERLRVLPCDHSFHVGCIDRWLSGSHSHHECFTSGCPTCKTRASESQDASDGSVPSWAFAKLGDALARSSSSVSA